MGHIVRPDLLSPLCFRNALRISILAYSAFVGAVGDLAKMVERSLSMREALGSMPRFSIFYSAILINFGDGEIHSVRYDMQSEKTFPQICFQDVKTTCGLIDMYTNSFER